MSLIIQDSKNTKIIDGGKVMLTDANGKEIIVNVKDINDASTYGSTDLSNIQNESKSTVSITCEITDEAGEIVNESNLISDIKSDDVVALDVTFEATHSGRRINYALYNSESMAEDASTFMHPFPKPLIKNHNRHEEPLGRVINSTFDKSEFVEDSDTINVTWRVSDKDAMLKFADGRYKTMSIGASANKITCNTCGKTILDSGKLKFCGHWRGETYKDSVCTWTMTGLDYREGSVVNDPADEYAQVKRIKVIKRGDSKMAKTDNSNEAGAITNSIEDIDSILNGTDNTAKEEPAKEEPVTDEGEKGKENTKDEPKEEPTDEKTDAEKLADAQAEVQALKDELEALKAQHEKEIAAKDAEIAAKDAEIAELKSAKESKDSELETKQSQLVSMAKLNKQLLTDSVMMLNPEIKDEELSDKSAKELNDMITDLKAHKPRVPGKVNNPSLVENDQNTIMDNNSTETTNVEKVRTMKDMEDVVSKLFRVQ